MKSKPIMINPSDMSEKEKTILSRFINHSGNKNFLFENQVYELKEENPQNPQEQISTSFMLTHNLMPRSCNNNPQDYRYEVFSFKQQFATGAFGMVFNEVGKLDANLNFKAADYIIKLQRCDDKNADNFQTVEPNFDSQLRFILRALNKENEFNKKKLMSFEKYMSEVELTKISGLGIKQPFLAKINENIIYTFTIIEYCHGEELFDLITKDDCGEVVLNTDLRISLSLELLRTLKNLHQKGLVHRDIKPENIMVDVDVKKAEIKSIRFIDFNLSKKASEHTSNAVGTPGYMSPEAYQRGVDVDYRCDIFSLGQIMALLWRAEPPDIPTSYEAFLQAMHPTFNFLFNGIADLSLGNQNAIRNMIMGMTKPNLKERISLDACINILESVQLQRRINSVNTAKDACALEIAHKKADELRNQLSKLERKCQSNEDPNPLFTNIKNAFNLALEQIDDDPLIIEQFVTKLAVKTLEKMKTKKELQDKIDQIFTSINAHRNELMPLFNVTDFQNEQFFKNDAFVFLLNQYKFILAKVIKFSQSELFIDNLPIIDKKLEKNIQKLLLLREQILIEIQKENKNSNYQALPVEECRNQSLKRCLPSSTGFFANTKIKKLKESYVTSQIQDAPILGY